MTQEGDSAISNWRAIARSVVGLPTSDGAGVNLTRVLGTQELRMVDPFLLLDEFKSDRPQDYLAGFPDHPHRGFETVTYMLAGRMRHGDSQGHSGVIEAGGVQWMTAGRGIIHSEMPEQEEGLLWGFQLWVNLPAAEKMKAPAYQEFKRDEIPEETRDGVVLRVIAGTTSQGTAGPVQGIPTAPLYLDVHLPPGAGFEEPLPSAADGFVYVYEGSAEVAGADGAAESLSSGRLGLLGPGEGVRLRAGPQGGRLLLLAGRPLNEPVAWGGPIVMNTREEILQAFEDMRSGRLA